VVKFALSQYMRSWEAGADLWTAASDVGNAEDSDECVKEVIAELLKVREMCAHLGVDCTDNATRAMNQIRQDCNGPVTMTLIRELEHAIQKELRSRLCFLMTKEESHLYGSQLLNADAALAFPHSSQELIGAARCLALDQPQACVFHSMNALEEPLGATARFFGKRFEASMWGTIIDSIARELAAITNSPIRSRAKTKILADYGEVAKEFTYFNHAWRIRVMHGRKSYDPHSARSVLNHVAEFINRISAAGLSTRTRKKYRI
jgi:hypothetical protein